MESKLTHNRLVAGDERSEAPANCRSWRRKLRHSHRAVLRGMTLLELVLALALSALLLMAISMALHIHWKAFDVRRSRVEEAQLATSILRRVSDDIRSTLKFEPPDLSGLNLASAVPAGVADLVSGAGGDDSGGQDGAGGGNDAGDNPMGDNGDGDSPGGGENNQQGGPAQGNPQQESNPDQGSPPPSSDTGGVTGFGSANGSQSSGTGGGSESTETQPVTESGPSVAVGLYGSATELQFDVSRLPRVDQYQTLASADGQTAENPSDIKTIVYFLQGDDALGAAGDLSSAGSGQPSLTGTGRGLMRAESDRAVSAWGEVNGSTESIYGSAKLLAAEVTSLQFQYYDGVEWLPEWNSDELGGLPLAIEVLFTLDSGASGGAAAAMPIDPLALPADQKVYRMVVQLPVGGKSSTSKETESAEATESMDADGAASMDGGAMP